MNINNIKQIHFIAIGGSVMHNLAIALHQKGIKVTGSDDEIYDPAASKLKNNNIEAKEGWDAARINADLDAVILGMHAKKDNPELAKAEELGLKIYSFPEFIRSIASNKQRIVVGGSHGKSTITAMIMHVLKASSRQFDYLVGAEVPGFELTVQLSDAPIIIIEGDEYLSSKLDLTPKFLKYNHHIAVISGIHWDHKNVFPTFDEYTHQFDLFADQTPKAGSIVYCEEDHLANIVGAKEREDVRKFPYGAHPSVIKDGITYLKTKDHGEVKVNVFGKHNMQNINAALEICKIIGLTSKQFYDAISSFKGAQKRLELLAEKGENKIFLDYAHAPSKLKATTNALKSQYPENKLIVAYELHTFSSLDAEFMKEYKDSMENADEAFIFINKDNLKLNSGAEYSEKDLQDTFNKKSIKFFQSEEELVKSIENAISGPATIAFLSSGHFGKLDLKSTAKALLQ